MNRRRVLIGVLELAFLPATRVAARPEVPVTPEAILTPGATPSADFAAYNGPLEDIWQQPWLLEKKLVSFDGVIIRIQTAPAGEGLPIDSDQSLYRSLVIMEIPDVGDRRLIVATNDDLSSLNDVHTAHVVGTYGGKQNYSEGGGWNVPLIIATSVGPVPTGTM